VQVSFVVYDLIPVKFGNTYPPGFKEGHADWLKVVAKADSAICISRAVADDLAKWFANNVPNCTSETNIRWFHLGADLDTSSPSTGLPDDAHQVLQQLSRAPSFLMVGTVEPRKGHGQVLDAFDKLWAKGLYFNLIVVGKEGWMVDALAERFRQHPELYKRLHWLEGVSDEYLLKVYASASCLLAASQEEGFGLPLIEAARHKIPIIARDISVFREVAGDHAFYFDSKEPAELAQAIKEWVGLYENGKHPCSDTMPWLTWEQSAQQLLNVVIGKGDPNSQGTTIQLPGERH
jgi:glycosyltransferase involved in cell wall biosynthesis